MVRDRRSTTKLEQTKETLVASLYNLVSGFIILY